MRDPRDLHRIYFVTTENKDHAVRTWPQVPHVGEHVMFDTKDGITVFEVKRVVWNTAPNDAGAPTVNVTIGKEET